MGKKNKHSKDKLYKTATELTSHHVGPNRDLELSTLHRRLKFDSCCLSLNSITGKPVGLCDEDAFCYVFESDLIIKFLEKFQLHPITGKKVTASDLFELKFHKNNDNQYHCPVIDKLFNQLSKIVANKRTGNVYSFEAYQEFNLKPKDFKDLLTDEPFKKGDIVTIQDPDKAEEKWTVTNFYYVKNKLRIDDDDDGATNVRNIDHSEILKASLDEYERQKLILDETHRKLFGEPVTISDKEKTKLDKFNSAPYSDGTLAKSVTSTVAPVLTGQQPALLSDEQILYPRIKERGYVQLVTNYGRLNLELYCNRCPKTCHNFLLLASRGYYDNTCFHRLVKNFILQGGDPTGTGSGGQSAWGKPFKDECHGDLKHEGRGVLAMANSGPNTNKSQFYITLRGKWDHLDGKHTVFGRVVGGDATLDQIEAIDVDKKDRPKREIKILSVVKYVDPFEKVQSVLDAERKKESNEDGKSGKRVFSKSNDELIKVKQASKKLRTAYEADDDAKDGSSLKPNCEATQGASAIKSSPGKTASGRKGGGTFGDFSDW